MAESSVVKNGGGQNTSSSVVAVLVCVVAAACAMTGMAGCRGGPELLDLTPPRVEAKLDMASAIALIETNARRWVTLDAVCDVAIRNMRIPRPGGQVQLTRGRLAIKKPGMVYLTCPNTPAPRIHLVGDGRSYRANVPVFGTSYAGSYGDSLPAGGVYIMPDDVADALDLGNLFANKVQTQTQGALRSTIYSMAALTGQNPMLLMVNSVTVDRRTGRILIYDKYAQDDLRMNRQDGSARVLIEMARYQTFLGAGDQPVDIPTVIFLRYGGTAVRLQLQDVRLNTELDDALFDPRG